MPLIPVNHMHCRHLLQHSQLPDPWEVTYGVRGSTIDSLLDAAGLASALQLSFETAFAAGMSDQVSFDGMLFTATLDNGTETGGFQPGGGPGLDTDSVPPPNVAMIVAKVTGLSGRRNRGRFFLPAYVDETNVDNRGRIDNTSINAAQTILDAWMADLEAITVGSVAATNMVVLHSTPPAAPAPVVLRLIPQPIVGSQRRRLQR